MAESPPYYYETEVEWRGEKDLKLYGGKLPPIGAGAPPEFNGREENWSPEHLFVAALNSCYALTLLAIAEFSKVSLVSLSSSAKGRLEKMQGSTYQVTEIVVRPRVVVASANDFQRMPRILDKAKENCLVSNSIKKGGMAAGIHMDMKTDKETVSVHLGPSCRVRRVRGFDESQKASIKSSLGRAVPKKRWRFDSGESAEKNFFKPALSFGWLIRISAVVPSRRISRPDSGASCEGRGI